MTWNVENLFAPAVDVGSGRSLSSGEYEAKLDYLASRINREQPTVLALQEIGGEQPVTELQGKLGGVYPHSSISTAPDRPGIRVGRPRDTRRDLARGPSAAPAGPPYRRVLLDLRAARIILDEWSVIPRDLQPYLADFLRRCVLPVKGASR